MGFGQPAVHCHSSGTDTGQSVLRHIFVCVTALKIQVENDV